MFRRPPLHYPDRPLHHFLQDAADRHPEKIALRFDDDVYMYRELDSCGNAFAHALGRLALGAHPRVALFVSNRPEWIIAQHGVSLAGGSVVLPNPTWKATEVRHAFGLTSPDVVVADAAFADVVDEVVGNEEGRITKVLDPASLADQVGTRRALDTQGSKAELSIVGHGPET